MKRDFSTFLLYALGFMLVWEWLKPLEQITTTDHIEIFLLFLFISFAASFFRLRWFWKWIIKLWFIFFSINRIYYEESFFQFQWLSSFLSGLSGDLMLVWERNWLELSDGFRTLLFFILLWLLVYLIQYWLLNRQRIFTFFLITLIYITVLDTFTAYNAEIAIIRTVVVGFAVMGMLNYYRIIVKENVSKDPSKTRKWMMPLALMITSSVLIGMAAPKLEPIWPDPVPYLKAADNKGGNDGNSGISRIGYGSNDEKLGGPFIADDSVVFRSEANGKNYWKVETKDVYTGKGWIPSGSTPITINSEDLIPVFSIPKTVETRDDTATLHLEMDYPHLIYPAGIQRVQFSQYYQLEIDTRKEKVSIKDNFGEPVAPDSYTMEYKVPKYKAKDLMETTFADPEKVGPEFIETYTQLPEGLPDRVKQLAEQITAGKTNWFDKARAVEQYFGSAQFTYDQQNVAIPGDKDDYVDQFLFDTKTGYCDNFSSSMAVLLRTLGIPTRWVKGYTGGDFIEYSEKDSSKSIYKITNNNAHSWVEVYFPNQGWVPFEPTKGFTNEVSINYIDENSVPTTPETTPPPVQKPQEEETAAKDDKTETKETVDFDGIWQNIKLFLGEHWKGIFLYVMIGGGTAGLLYRIRGRWVPYLYLLRFRWRKKDENIGEAYLILLKQLDRYGIKRKENQTLRNYANYIDTFFSTREMTKLTARYEQYLYHEQIPEGGWEESRELWENLIKKTIA